MPRFSKLAGSSAGAGFQYYDIKPFSFTIPGQFIPKVSAGVFHFYTGSFSMPKNVPASADTGLIMTDVIMRANVDDAAGQYRLGNKGIGGGQVLGSGGGFPILYSYNVYVGSDANNLIFVVEVGNSSGVNDVTAPAITIDGKVFFYLAPF